MKKWLIRCLTVLAMVCLIPGIVLKAAAETVPVYCLRCGIREEREVRRYEKYDSTYHRVYVTECPNCHNAVAPGAVFCPHCGRPLAEESCPRCGAPACGVSFCPRCGFKIK